MEKKLNGKTETKSSKDSKKIVKRDEKGRLLPGSVLNEKGKVVGTVDFKTKWIAFMERIAAENKVSVSELDHKMMTVAFKQMQDGKFPYWKDVNDRLYGQATQQTDITSGGKPIPIINVSTNPSHKQDTGNEQKD
jgi:hypothetical protein